MIRYYEQIPTVIRGLRMEAGTKTRNEFVTADLVQE